MSSSTRPTSANEPLQRDIDSFSSATQLLPRPHAQPLPTRSAMAQTSVMVLWIVVAVVVALVVVLWRLLRGLWKESHARVVQLPPASVRRGWPAPSAIGERVLGCPP